MTNQERPAACLGCNMPFRPRRSKAADWPGTREHSGLGRCNKCRGAMWHNGQARTQAEAKTTEENRRGVENWLASHWRPSKTVKVVKP